MNPYEIAVMHSSLHSSYEYYFGPRKRKRKDSMLSFKSFHNALRLLRSIDYHEVPFLTDAEWEIFREKPYDFFITTSDINALAIWKVIQSRQPKHLRAQDD
jgi:hypothetical protein